MCPTHLFDWFLWAPTIDIAWLCNYRSDWDSQVSVSCNRVQALTALVICYNFHIQSVVQYLGGEYIGEHWPMQVIQKTLASYAVLFDIGDALLQLLEENVPRQI